MYVVQSIFSTQSRYLSESLVINILFGLRLTHLTEVACYVSSWENRKCRLKELLLL